MRGLFNLVLTVGLVLIVFAFLQILPDLKRYLRMHRM
jgi:TRAP-type C4-dicarboxylate transport system permease small subunit